MGYIEGGNTFWLYYCMMIQRNKEQNYCWGSLIKNTICNNNTIYCGKSAGAIIAGTYIKTACWKQWDDPSIVPNMESYNDWDDNEYYGLDFYFNNKKKRFMFFTHMNDEWNDLIQKKKKELKKDNSNKDDDDSVVDVDLITLRDDEVFCIMDDDMNVEN